MNEKKSNSSSTTSIDLKATSFELEFDGIVVKHGTASQINLDNLTFEDHFFYMHVGDYEVNWKITYENETTEIKNKKSDIWFVPANATISKVTNDTHEFIAVRLKHDKLVDSAKNIIDNNVILKPIYNIKDPHLEHIFKLMLSEVQTNNTNGKYFIDSLVSLLSIHFIGNYCIKNTDLVENIDGLIQKDFDNIINYINNNLSNNITLEQLSSDLKMDKFDLIKKFKKSKNITPYQFIIQRKLEHSKYLLRNKAYSISDIANMLNFSDQAHFSNTFKKMFGLTPNKYKQNAI